MNNKTIFCKITYIFIGDVYLSIIKYSTKEKNLLARLMRAEALGEGDLGMLMVGNVIVNRALADCLTFKNIRTITDVVYQSPGGFVGVNSSLFVAVVIQASTALMQSVFKLFFPSVVIRR